MKRTMKSWPWRGLLTVDVTIMLGYPTRIVLDRAVCAVSLPIMSDRLKDLSCPAIISPYAKQGGTPVIFDQRGCVL